MFTQLPDKIDEFTHWTWMQIRPFYVDLEQRPLNPMTLTAWLRDWTKLGNLLHEWQSRLYVATTQDTTNNEAEIALNQFMADIYPHMATAENNLKQRLLESGLQPEGLEIALEQMHVDAELFTEANIPLAADSVKLNQRYNKIIGTQTVSWQGQEMTLTQLATELHTPNRAYREQGWRLMAERRLQDRQALNELWREMHPLRQQIAHNAGYADYRAYVWREKKRFAYSPEDAEIFQKAILSVAVPAASRVYNRYAQRLGVDHLRPWDVVADLSPYSLPALRPFSDINEFADISTHIFHQVDPVLGHHFQTMRQENMLDLPNRKGKAPGAYCAYYPTTQRPFIFMNSVGTGEDVRTLLHEAGHAFHGFAITPLPYYQQKRSPMEFSEVASMAMELLATPYLARDNGGFFTQEEVAQWRTNHLEKIILFWPYMAVVDAFQHWAYTHEEGSEPTACDAKWAMLWHQYIPDIDFSGFEDVMMTGWHRKQHIFRAPFYYIEYGLAQLGALQVWRNALHDQSRAVAAYRQALALGGTRPLPELYATANTRFALDETIMKEMIALLEEQLRVLEEAV